VCASGEICFVLSCNGSSANPLNYKDKRHQSGFDFQPNRTGNQIEEVTNGEKLARGGIIPAREGFRSQGARTQGEQSMQRAIRMLILMVGLAGAYVAVAAPMLPAPDGGPIPTCRQKVCPP